MQNTPTFLPTDNDSKAVISIAAALQTSKGQRQPLLLLPNGQKQMIPQSLAGVLATAAQAMTSGYAVSVTVHTGTLTTQQAADMLTCSRQHVVKLINEKKLPAEKVPGGTHRRIKLKELLKFMNKENSKREHLMDEMAAITEEIGGYDEFYNWKRKRRIK